MALSDKCPGSTDGKHEIGSVEVKGGRTYTACKHCAQRP